MSAIGDTINTEITERANFVSCFRRLSAEDQQVLAKVMGELHNELDREFISTRR